MNFEDRLAELAKQYKQRTDATEEDIRRVSQDFDRARRAKGKAKRSLGLLWGGGAGLSAAAVATWLVVVLMTPAVNQADYGLLDEMLQDTERVQADGGWLRGLMAEPDALGLGGTGDGGQALALSVQVFAVSEDALGESDSLDEVEAETVDGSNDGGASAHVGSGRCDWGGGFV